MSSKIQCTDLCDQVESCVSVNIEKLGRKNFKCELNTHWPMDNCSDLSTRENSQFYRKVTKTTVVLLVLEFAETSPQPHFEHNYQNCFQVDLKIQENSCMALKNKYKNPPSGVYCVQPDPDHDCIRVYCEMKVAGGGWTLVKIFNLFMWKFDILGLSKVIYCARKENCMCVVDL